jgi:peptide/nickel transport system substrate-binding protein
VGVLTALLLVLIWAAEAAGDARGSTDGTVYRRPLGNEPATLDPALIADIYGRSVSQQIFDGLVAFDHTLAIVPSLAEFWRGSRDGLMWTFNLRKGARFHHGREVTADDVVYSFTRILDPRLKSGGADLFAHIKGAQEFREGRALQVAGLVAVDRHTVQVTLTEAPVPFVSILAVGHAKVVPRDVAERGELGRHPVGTGPFRFVRWERGKEIVLVANPQHFEGAPRLSRLVYRLYPGGQLDAMYDDFRRGNLEDAPVPNRDYRRVVTAKDHVYIKRPMFGVRFYGFNTRLKPLNDRRVRQAFLYAIDRETLLEEVFLGRHLVARGILPPGTQGYNAKLAGYPYDPGRASALLAEAGYPGGRGLSPIVIWSSVTNEAITREHDRIRSSLETVGIPVEFKYLMDWPAFSKALTEGKLPVSLYAWFADVPDPDNFLFKLFHSKSPRNFMGYANAAVDDLLVQARQDRDLVRRVELYRRAEQLIVEDAPVIPVWHYTYERLFQPYVRNIEVSGLGDPYLPLRKMWLERPP